MTTVTTPFERELDAMKLLVDEVKHGRVRDVVILVDENHRIALVDDLIHDAIVAVYGPVEGQNGWAARRLRDGFEFGNGARIVVTGADPRVLFGRRPERMIVMGRLAELLWHLESAKADGTEVRLVA